MSRFEEYRERYPDVQMERTDGILEVTLSTDGGSLVLCRRSHADLPAAFADIANDPDNRVVILTGGGDEFGMRRGALPGVGDSPSQWDTIMRDGRRMLMNYLDIGVPVITAVNGPAYRHAELAVLGDVVLAADTATFSDGSHFPSGLVPGDGSHIVWPMLLGVNRGSYFLMTDQVIDAAESLSLGLVNEVLRSERLMPRAREVAAQLASKSDLTLRYTRQVLNLYVKKLMQDMLPLGFALEGLAFPSMGRGVPSGELYD